MPVQFSIATSERLVAASYTLEHARARIEELKGRRTEAKGTLEDREKSLEDVIEEATAGRAKGDAFDSKTSERIISGHRDLRRASDQFDVIDREYKSATKTVKDLHENIQCIIELARDGEGLFDAEAGDEDRSNAYSLVHIVDIMGSEVVADFEKISIRTVGELVRDWKSGALGAYIAAGDITTAQAEAGCMGVREYLTHIARADELPTTMPGQKKPAAPASAQAPTSKKTTKKKVAANAISRGIVEISGVEHDEFMPIDLITAGKDEHDRWGQRLILLDCQDGRIAYAGDAQAQCDSLYLALDECVTTEDLFDRLLEASKDLRLEKLLSEGMGGLEPKFIVAAIAYGVAQATRSGHAGIHEAVRRIKSTCTRPCWNLLRSLVPAIDGFASKGREHFVATDVDIRQKRAKAVIKGSAPKKKATKKTTTRKKTSSKKAG